MERLPDNWRSFLNGNLRTVGLEEILMQVETDRARGQVFPPAGKVFHALELTPPAEVKVVLLGQDPYHNEGQAEGLAFSVSEKTPLPPSLRNIFKEYVSDLGRPQPVTGSLVPWAKHGILLLNCVLTVAANSAGSHRKFGWEKFTDAVIATLSEKFTGLVFLLWGNYAIGKKSLIDSSKHTIIESAHPSPLSARRGFFGSRPFSRTEEAIGNNWHWPEL